MASVLDEIAAYAKERVRKQKEKYPIELLKQKCSEIHIGGENKFFSALSKPDISFICEIKKASPSKGIIAEKFPYIEIAGEYETAGADCISCLTEPNWFLGSDDIFKEVRKTVDIPMLRKDFTVDEYQIYEAKLMGADAVLLICAILDTSAIRRYLDICKSLGLDALVEAHDEREINSALEAGAQIIGVNNRNLKDFTVDFSNAERLRQMIPQNKVFVSESGVKSTEDIAILRGIGADAVLIGETLMRAENKADMLAGLRGMK